MATHSSILAWKILWMEEPVRLQSMGLLKKLNRSRVAEGKSSFCKQWEVEIQGASERTEFEKVYSNHLAQVLKAASWSVTFLRHCWGLRIYVRGQLWVPPGTRIETMK